MLANIENALSEWTLIAPLLEKPENEKELESLIVNLDIVLDAGGADEDHPLASLADIMGDLVEAYESGLYGDIPEATGPEVLKHLMVEYGLKQCQIPEVGSQGVVSEVLSGKRKLNVHQMKALPARFGVPAAVFL